MGFLGGKTDMVGLRLVEIWASVPFLYMVIILGLGYAWLVGGRMAGLRSSFDYGALFMDGFDLLCAPLAVYKENLEITFPPPR